METEQENYLTTVVGTTCYWVCGTLKRDTLINLVIIFRRKFSVIIYYNMSEFCIWNKICRMFDVEKNTLLYKMRELAKIDNHITDRIVLFFLFTFVSSSIFNASDGPYNFGHIIWIIWFIILKNLLVMIFSPLTAKVYYFIQWTGALNRSESVTYRP